MLFEKKFSLFNVREIVSLCKLHSTKGIENSNNGFADRLTGLYLVCCFFHRAHDLRTDNLSLTAFRDRKTDRDSREIALFGIQTVQINVGFTV